MGKSIAVVAANDKSDKKKPISHSFGAGLHVVVFSSSDTAYNISVTWLWLLGLLVYSCIHLHKQFFLFLTTFVLVFVLEINYI